MTRRDAGIPIAAALSPGTFIAELATCEARAKRGTGEGVCGRRLDVHGNCDRAAAHVSLDRPRGDAR